VRVGRHSLIDTPSVIENWRGLTGIETLYLLVWNPRSGATNASLLEEYLLNIRSRAPSSRVIFVTTHGMQMRWMTKTPGDGSMC
jgi:hypothetical protein